MSSLDLSARIYAGAMVFATLFCYAAVMFGHGIGMRALVAVSFGLALGSSVMVVRCIGGGRDAVD